MADSALESASGHRRELVLSRLVSGILPCDLSLSGLAVIVMLLRSSWPNIFFFRGVSRHSTVFAFEAKQKFPINKFARNRSTEKY
jgi:hypothetical protein